MNHTEMTAADLEVVRVREHIHAEGGVVSVGGE